MKDTAELSGRAARIEYVAKRVRPWVLCGLIIEFGGSNNNFFY